VSFFYELFVEVRRFTTGVTPGKHRSTTGTNRGWSGVWYSQSMLTELRLIPTEPWRMTMKLRLIPIEPRQSPVHLKRITAICDDCTCLYLNPSHFPSVQSCIIQKIIMNYLLDRRKYHLKLKQMELQLKLKQTRINVIIFARFLSIGVLPGFCRDRPSLCRGSVWVDRGSACVIRGSVMTFPAFVKLKETPVWYARKIMFELKCR
jgi:hypothetical protein